MAERTLNVTTASPDDRAHEAHRDTLQIGIPDVELELDARPDEIDMLLGRPSAVWRYTGRVMQGPDDALEPIAGSYVGPVLRLETGQKVRVHFRNRRVQPSSVHWHGLLVPERMNGHPRDVVAPEDEYLYEFEVRNRAGTYWFHAHPHGLTGGQVNAGLAGLILITDDEERSLGLPDGERDIPIVLTDCTFDCDNQFVYNPRPSMGMMALMTGFVGEHVLANGRPSLAIAVANESHRIRLLNGANSRIYCIARSDTEPLVVIGTDAGLLEAPEVRPFVVVGPGERIEILLDLHGESVGSRVALLAQPIDFDGTDTLGGVLKPPADQPLPFVVFTVARQGNSSELPLRLAEPRSIVAHRESRVREFAITMGGAQWGINGRAFAMEAVADDERVCFGDSEVWVFKNCSMAMAMPHSMHVHGVQFHVLDRCGTPGELAWMRAGIIDGGLKDTVLVLPGEEVKVLAKFDAFPGMFMYECQNLEHQDMGMMRNNLVT